MTIQGLNIVFSAELRHKKDVIESNILCSDAYKEIKKMDDGFFKLIITSPPYNIGKTYEKKVSLENYLKEQEIIIKELVRVLDDSGSLCWQVGNYINNKEVISFRYILLSPIQAIRITIAKQNDMAL